MRSVLLAVAILAPASVGRAAEPFFLRDGQRVLFLGDSNTHARLYISYIDAFLVTRLPQWKVELINLGLSSETVSGLSEPEHPYPRPDLHERLNRALARTKPDVVVACYGMNDGIYYPFSNERFGKYQDGIRRLIDKVRKAGARLVLLTPPPFDPRPLGDKVLDESAYKFSYSRPFRSYDDVLKRYAEWLLTLREDGVTVADSRGAMTRFLAAARKEDPQYRLAADGVHFSATGHAVLARELLRAWHAPTESETATIDVQAAKGTGESVRDVVVDKEVIRFTWTPRLPMPADPTWDACLSKDEAPGQNRLLVRGASRPRYDLFEGDTRVGVVPREQLEKGFDLAGLKDLSLNRRAAEVGKLVDRRQQLLGAAWLDEVGHKRPDTPKGKPLEEARREGQALDARIREMAKPVAVTLTLKPPE